MKIFGEVRQKSRVTLEGKFYLPALLFILYFVGVQAVGVNLSVDSGFMRILHV